MLTAHCNWTTVLNGACSSGWCTGPNGTERYHVGAPLCWCVLQRLIRVTVAVRRELLRRDIQVQCHRYHRPSRSCSRSVFLIPTPFCTPPINPRRFRVVPQLPQTAYHALLTPYAFLGLGRTNNYLEALFVGGTGHAREHFVTMEGVVPNSRVVVIPPSPGAGGSWRRELYLRPGRWIPWVTLTVALATGLLAGVVGLLHLGEKVSGRHYGMFGGGPDTYSARAEGRRAGAEEGEPSYQLRRAVNRLGQCTISVLGSPLQRDSRRLWDFIHITKFRLEFIDDL